MPDDFIRQRETPQGLQDSRLNLVCVAAEQTHLQFCTFHMLFWKRRCSRLSDYKCGSIGRCFSYHRVIRSTFYCPESGCYSTSGNLLSHTHSIGVDKASVRLNCLCNKHNPVSVAIPQTQAARSDQNNTEFMEANKQINVFG